MSWWLRLRRLWAQDRIRLSARDLRAPQLQVGDRLEILGQLWAVEEKRAAEVGSPAAPHFLVATLGVPRRRAVWRRSPRSEESPPASQVWWLQDGTGIRRVQWRDVVHYAVGPPARGRSLLGTAARQRGATGMEGRG